MTINWERIGLGNDGDIASFEEIKLNFRIDETLLYYQGQMESLPIELKRRQRFKKEPVIHSSIQEVLNQKKEPGRHTIRFP